MPTDTDWKCLSNARPSYQPFGRSYSNTTHSEMIDRKYTEDRASSGHRYGENEPRDNIPPERRGVV
ncbi:putative scaffold protein salvador [Anopheles sinensis]|uniref:Putative scaffold protein salvador n=1 Tax=Anopheles sinensis TaxID=74873 RepID=A0A084VA13_ANOSI|nr:putative scaffold protein salvador [Anopheles sinensis]